MLIKDLPIEELLPKQFTGIITSIERIVKYGPSKLSNEELLSIILRCGTKNKSVNELSIDIIKEFGNIYNLKNSTINRLNKINGMGLSKSTIILALVELGRRMYLEDNNKKLIFKNPKDIFIHTKYLFNNKKQELFYCLYLNNKQELIGEELLFIGTVNKSITHPREVFKEAYLYSASSIICLHNHPSGDVTPSKDDIVFTEALKEIGIIQKIPILDHIIVSNNNYYSFHDNNLL